MTTTDRPTDGDAASSLSWLAVEDEEIRWRGGPRIQTVLPGVVVAVALVAAAVGVPWARVVGPAVTPWVPALLVVVAPFPPLAAYLWVRSTEYVVTDRTLYRKRGWLSRRVTAVGYETVQNVSYSQGVTGTMFDWGHVAVDTAGGGGTELSFRRVNDPREIQRLVETQLSAVRSRGGAWDRPDGTGEDRSVPGTAEQWAQILAEVRALRATVERRREG